MREQQPTALSLLVDWANEQDRWVRAIVADLIESRKTVSDDRLEYFHDILLLEKELKAGEALAVPKLVSPAGPSNGESALTLMVLKNLQRVNALASGQEIAFNPTMTVLFGENAAGKTGYVRVLKGAASVRTAKPILPNINDTPRLTPNPAATIAYKLGDVETSVEWQGEAGVYPLTRIDVFDAPCATIHVDEELLTYTYTPSDLALFRLAHEAMERVKARLEAQRKEALPSGNPILSRFARESFLYAKIESLGAATNISELETLAQVSEEERQGLDALRERVQALGSRTSAERLQVVRSEHGLFQDVKAAADTFAEFDAAAYSSALSALEKSREAHSRATEMAFAGEIIPELLSDAWKAFIRAGEDYLANIKADAYPTAGDPCVYCRQSLDDAAIVLLKKYRAFCNDALARAVTDSSRALELAARPALRPDIQRLRDDLVRKSSAFPDPDKRPGLLVRALDFVALAESVQVSLRANTALPGQPFGRVAADAATLADAHATELAKTVAQLSQETTERAKALASESARLHQLEARIQLRELLPQIRDHVEKAKWAEKVRPILSRIQATQRSLTETAKVASQDLLNHDFGQRFEVECRALRAPKVSLDFPGRRGEAARRKSLVPDHKLSEILSEGEQKVIALADFIAEASLKRSSAPLVFDDPVNSLDYRRLRYVAQRCVELSASRQVIVFTHNIWFATEILSHFEDRTGECFYYDVSEADKLRGFVTRGSHPRWDTVSKTSGRINQLIQEARAARNAGPEKRATEDALVESAYGYLRNLTETIVEQELFCGVTQRYSPHVAMTRLPDINVDRLSAAIAAIVPIYEKACRVTEAHSQPLETLSIRPTLDELVADWEAVQAARNAYRAK